MPKTATNVLETKFTARDGMSRAVRRMTSRLGKMRAKAARLGRTLKRAARSVMRFGKALGRIALRGLAVGAAAVTGLFMGVSKLAGGMDELAKKARSMDFPIEEFQQWRFVAEQSGVDGDKFSTTLQKFSKNIGDAKSGVGTMTTILKKNDKQFLKQLKNTENVEQAFDTYVKKLRTIEDPTKRAALANAAFGRTGVDMLNIVGQTEEQIESLKKEMRSIGVVTEKQAKKAEQFVDMMNATKLTLMSVARDALMPLIPLFTKVADRIKKYVSENKELIRQKVKDWIENIKDALKSAYHWWAENKDAVFAFASKVWEMLGSVKDFVKYLSKNKAAIASFGLLIAGIAASLGGLPAAIVITLSMIAGNKMAKWFNEKYLKGAKTKDTEKTQSLEGQVDRYRKGTVGKLSAKDRKQRIQGLQGVLKEERFAAGNPLESFRHGSGKRHKRMMLAQQGIDALKRDTQIEAGKALRGAFDKVKSAFNGVGGNGLKESQPAQVINKSTTTREEVVVTINNQAGGDAQITKNTSKSGLATVVTGGGES